LVASNLAAGLAMAGHNVILIDVDMRRPRAHEIFGVPLEPGLSNALVSKTKAADVIHRASIPNLWVVSAGKIPPNPAELLSSQAFRAWVNAVKPHFDWVVLDAPPVLAVTDASIVAHTAAGVIFVTSADMTDQQAAARAVDQLSAAKARFLGAVLNRVNLKRNAFFYAPYYRQEYTDYYARSSHS
jgi:capsular exopolysaccharide synthesis family protein